MNSFDSWNLKKQALNDTQKELVRFHPRELWWCSYGVNIGSEQNGVGDNFERLCLIVQKLSAKTFIALPLSTKEKLPKFQVRTVIKEKIGYVLLDQVRVLDSKRLLRKIGSISSEEFEEIKSRLKEIL